MADHRKVSSASRDNGSCGAWLLTKWTNLSSPIARVARQPMLSALCCSAGWLCAYARALEEIGAGCGARTFRQYASLSRFWPSGTPRRLRHSFSLLTLCAGLPNMAAPIAKCQGYRSVCLAGASFQSPTAFYFLTFVVFALSTGVGALSRHPTANGKRGSDVRLRWRAASSESSGPRPPFSGLFHSFPASRTTRRRSFTVRPRPRRHNLCVGSSWGHPWPYLARRCHGSD